MLRSFQRSYDGCGMDTLAPNRRYSAGLVRYVANISAVPYLPSLQLIGKRNDKKTIAPLACINSV